MRRAQCGVRRSEPGSRGTRGNPGGVTSGPVPERHRELVPHRRPDWQRSFRDGRAMPFTRAVPPHRSGQPTADRGQCVSATGRNSKRRLRGVGVIRGLKEARERGRTKAVATSCERRQRGAQGTGGRATVHGIAARAHHPSPTSSARAGPAPWSSHGPRRYRQQNTRDARCPERQVLKALR